MNNNNIFNIIFPNNGNVNHKHYSYIILSTDEKTTDQYFNGKKHTFRPNFVVGKL